MSLWFPVLAQVVLTFSLLFYLGHLRIGCIRRGEVKIRDVALGQPNWPTRAIQVANCFRNQSETPILFYVLVVMCELNKLASPVLTAGAWLFILTRYLHAYVEVTRNYVPTRFKIFIVGTFTLLGLWAFAAAKLVSQS